MMKNLLIISCLTITLTALAQTPSYLCQLSISSPSGASSLCNAVYIGEGKLLSAGHCFPEGQRTVNQGIILASCGGEEFMDFTRVKKSNSSKNYFNEDLSLLEFHSSIKGEAINPTRYPSMYFVSNQLRDGVQCEVLALRGEYPSQKLKRIKISKMIDLKVIDNSSGPAQIIMRPKNGGIIPDGLNVKEGDSGGALICRYSKFAKEELVGIIANYGSDRNSGQIIQNAFSPVFGSEAKRLLEL